MDEPKNDADKLLSRVQEQSIFSPFKLNDLINATYSMRITSIKCIISMLELSILQSSIQGRPYYHLYMKYRDKARKSKFRITYRYWQRKADKYYKEACACFVDWKRAKTSLKKRKAEYNALISEHPEPKIFQWSGEN